MGFAVERTKLEAAFSNPGVPVTDEAAFQLSPHVYFEFHHKLRLPPNFDGEALRQLVTSHGARLSRSALKRLDCGTQHRFVTLRLYNVGRYDATPAGAPTCGCPHLSAHGHASLVHAGCRPRRGSML